ncbi:DEAD/DEAH box helicase, partial [Enterococcus faecium]|nr:DEAD/DEAH box helicase [Enterococcus faecium]
ALVISATGTGKTYLGAFDVKKFSPDKFLYIVHREQILDKTISSFKKILSNEPAEDFGKVSGNSKDFEGKYLFATIQTLSRDNWLERFDKDEFDYILVDETHRAGAESYKKVLNYFTPQFMLGMTATPDRMDNFNLYELFDYNIAYEIRLQKALDENMLCPFHYIGITDYEVDGQITDDTSQLNWLVSEDRVDYVIKQTEYYSYSGEALQGLIFCSRTEEAKRLAETLSLKRHPSKALTGETPQWEREKIIEELEQRKIEYIITVDVFNEGIDIPCVNQVVMLRNTQSSIVFIQQLGRGLR